MKMKKDKANILEDIQQLIAATLATSPAGYNLCLIGGFRFRLLDNSARSSIDVDYHWEKNLEEKQKEVISLLRRNLLSEVKHKFGYDGTVTPATVSNADSPLTKQVDLSFYRKDVPYSRIEITVDITRIECLDSPIVRTKGGVVYLTASDEDIIESKVISLFNRIYIQERDMVDIFLFADKLSSDSAGRIAKKFARISLDQSGVSDRLKKIIANRDYHIRNIEEVIDNQVDPLVADRIREAGGAAMVFEHVLKALKHQMKLGVDGES
jgi:hypothetical protein